MGVGLSWLATMSESEAEIQSLLERVPRLRAEIAKAVVGQPVVVDELLTAFVAVGHCLLEGLPGQIGRAHV